MRAESLQLTVRAERYATAGRQNLARLVGEILDHELVRVGQDGTAERQVVDLLVRRKAGELRVGMHVDVAVPEVFSRQTSGGDHQRRRMRDPAFRHQANNVAVNARQREGVLHAREAVQRHGEIQLEVRGPFGRWRQLLLARGHHQPLPMAPVAHVVILERLGVIEVRVAAGDVARIVQTAQILGGEDAAGGGEDPRTDNVARRDLVGIGQDIRRHRLRIPRRGHPVCEVGEVFPDLPPVDAPRDPHVVVDVHVSRQDCLAGDVDLACARRDCHGPTRADRGDAVVGDDDIGVLDHLVTLHRDHARAA